MAGPWGGLNPALTSWRAGINLRFPRRGTGSDGGYADKVHGSNSEHQQDPDGSVDAFDQDVNVLGSRVPTGTPEERALMATLKQDFEADRYGRGLLWIHDGEIANSEIGNWRQRDYTGDNPHDRHAHWQSRQSRERDDRPWAFTHTDALLARMRGDLPVDAAEQDQLAAKIAKAIMDAPIKVGGETWKYGTAVGYLTRKAYEIDKTLDATAAVVTDVTTAAAAVTPTANTPPPAAAGD